MERKEEKEGGLEGKAEREVKRGGIERKEKEREERGIIWEGIGKGGAGD